VAGDRASEDCLGNPADGNTEVARTWHSPHAGALGACFFEHDVNERLAGLRVDLTQHLGGDLDQVALQVAGVPFGEHVGDCRRGVAAHLTQQVVGLGDELHVDVLNAVVR
jgi:hypothetical protein